MAQDVYAVAIEGIKVLNSLDELPASIAKAAQMAVNATTRRARTSAARSMLSQVAFPASYLTGSRSRLNITKFATADDLEAKITGRSRPTSLARFIVGTPRVGGGAATARGVNVAVKPGLARRLTSAFVIKLRAGNGDGDGFNLGLAVRTRDGRKPASAYKPVKLGKNVWLLYGPSVDQVFNKTREMIAPDAETFMEREFGRLVDLRL